MKTAFKDNTVYLGLSVKEFAALDMLRYRGLNGMGKLRDGIEQGFEEVFEALPAHLREAIERARPITGEAIPKIIGQRIP
jgi:hypothetical protein